MAKSAVKRCPFIVAVDTREQVPWQFEGIPAEAGRTWAIETSTVTIGAGDYSIVGHENRIAIERKSLSDLYGTLGHGRDRFAREIDRLAALEVAAVVIEADWMEIMTAPPIHSGLHPHSVRGSIIAWAERVPKIHWWPCPGRVAAERFAFALLDRYYRDYIEASQLDGVANGLARDRGEYPLLTGSAV